MANESSWAEPGGGSGARHQGEGGLACATWRNSLSHSRKGRQKKREKGREQGRKEGARLRERGQTTCIHSGRIVYASVLECVAAGGDFDRCGTHVAQLCTEEGRTGGTFGVNGHHYSLLCKREAIRLQCPQFQSRSLSLGAQESQV